ncbi:MAG TPA: M23 family metallopeptidase [Rhodospirillales bacterium]|nr:M23 family metallopeptidase [Rhodospirillales bacterium]
MNTHGVVTRVAGAVLVAGALLAEAGCGWVEWPPPGPGPHSASRPPAERPPPVSDRRFVGAGAVIVGRGDTVHALARRHRVPVRAIIDANGLRPPYHLAVGQRIALPRGRSHVVKAGDTLYGVSRLYGVDSYALARANGIGAPYTVRVGQELAIPTAKVALARVQRVTPAARAAPAPRQPPVKTPPRAVSRPPARSGAGFRWPVEGRVISAFGPRAKGLHNDGINIAAPPGAPVGAVENGVVAYAGNEIRGFGNLLLIKHSGGWISAYAHNAELLVRRGDRVERGQVIAKIGSSGNVTTPQLHFELRRGKRAVDPRAHLDAGRA